MLYLEHFSALSRVTEEKYYDPGGPYDQVRDFRNYTTRYPFNVFRYRELPRFTFAPLTFFYGGNGSGKTTLLNIIAEKLGVRRGAVFNRTDYFDDYVKRCRFKAAPGQTIPAESKIITSDDVFDYLLDLRCMNQRIDLRRGELFDFYLKEQSVVLLPEEQRREHNRMRGLDEYDNWRRRIDAQGEDAMSFIRDRLIDNVRESSNGESALQYFTESIKENALYLLDEPENSLSAPFQMDLKRFLEDSVRFYRCQFIISTHSPFLLSIKDALIYDLDAEPPCPKRWTELGNVRMYYRFFEDHRAEFAASEPSH